MAGGLGQYIRDTRGELRHVAWPTRTQTIVYTILVAAISIGVAVYLGLFDFLLTAGLSHLLNVVPAAKPAVQTPPITVTKIATSSANAPQPAATH